MTHTAAWKKTISLLYPELAQLPLLHPKQNQSQHEEANLNQQLHSLSELLQNCTKCALHIGRSKLVFGMGNPKAKLCFVGTSPSQSDNQAGLPFQGERGELLTKMINAIQLQREDVYLLNIVKCRPPNNRNITHEEADACYPFLMEQFKLLSPLVIVTMGEMAAQILLRTDSPLSSLRGKTYMFENTKVFATHHPEELLKNPTLKRAAWDDLKLAKQSL